MKRRIIFVLYILLSIYVCSKPSLPIAIAEDSVGIMNPNLTCKSVVEIDSSFGAYQKAVDENIYYSMSTVNDKKLVSIFGENDTPMFSMAKATINPCMAFATSWGEAGQSYAGVSLTTVMDFNPATYNKDIDWISVSKHLEQVNSDWYIANAMSSYNTNESGKAYHIPNALLQIPRGGSRQTSDMTGLGVGPYQITSSDWNKWILDNRVNPVYGFEDSLRKCGTSWIYCNIEPISDLTVYAVLSLSHQGGSLINCDFGKELISILNSYEVQQAFLDAGYDMYKDALEKSYSRNISLYDINVVPYLTTIESRIGIDFSRYTGGVGSTNKGDYTAKHLLRYVFYKFYFTMG